ncbi:response regulator transcription factor [Streptomyces sp. NTK 937]|uniref:response regulator transcription factor n=1 Tax=Streptomyces sp. NTK 937 TaxID=1487711 RepID=UPI0004A8E1A0|nr:response regulator transcription factor [Streptomyces sp. NTK 937]KDQ69216.1 LuxR family transcriptional regulator [Streptomyces sp. NTK 937]
MPEDLSRTSGPDRAPHPHVSPHASPHSTPTGADHSSQGLPAAGRTAPASEALPPFPSGPALPPPGTVRVVVADDNPVVRAGLGALLGGRADIEVVAEAADGREAYDAAVRHRPDVVLLDVRMPGVDGISALPHLVRVAHVMMLTYSRESDIVHEALRLGACGYLVHGEFTADQLVQAVRDTESGRAHFTATAADALRAHVRQDRDRTPRHLPEGLGTAPATGTPNGEPGGPARSPGGAAHAAPRPGRGGTPPTDPREVLSHLQPTVAQSSTDGDRHRPPFPNRTQYHLSSREAEVMELIASGMSNHQIAATCFISEKTVKNHINRIFTKLHSGSRSEAIARWLGTAPGPGPGVRGTGHHG